LKKQIKDLQKALGEREQEVFKLKKDINKTKYHELEVESKMYQDECKRMRHLVEAIMRRRGILTSDPKCLIGIDETIKQ
jgi:hypothetical protein